MSTAARALTGRPLPVQAIGLEVNSPWQRGSFMGCFRVRSRERFPAGQNVGKRDSAVRAALGLFEKADCDRLGNRIARGRLAGVRVAGEHCQSSDTFAATFRNCFEDRLRDSLFGSTKYAEVNGSRYIDGLLSHGRPSKKYARAPPSAWWFRCFVLCLGPRDLLLSAKHLFIAARVVITPA